MTCSLCLPETTACIYRTNEYRVIWADDTPDYPLFIRVIWQAHVAEMSELSMPARIRLMAAVWRVEQAFLQLPEMMRPCKINLASLGNQVPHLHWHVIARYHEDAHFPAPIWAPPQKIEDAAVLIARQALRNIVEARFKALMEEEKAAEKAVEIA